MEALVDPTKPCVSVMAPIQSGKTMLLEIASCYIVANLPGPMLWLDRDDDDAKDQSESRLQKLWAECAPVKAQLQANRNKTKLAATHFRNGMSFHCLGAHNKGNLQRRSVRWLIGDETWQWPKGHMAEAEARVTAFGWLGKRFFVSQGGEDDDDTDKKWKSGDQREWLFSCPHCNHEQAFEWHNVSWDTSAKNEDGTWNFADVRASATMRCVNEDCTGDPFPDTQRTRALLNSRARYVAQNPTASGEVTSYHWNALCCSSWGMLVELYLRAKETARSGDITDLKIFYQKRLALPWRENLEEFKLEIKPGEFKLGDAWDGEGAFDASGSIVPFGSMLPGRVALLRLMTVDVQLDHFFYVIRAWAADGSSRLVARGKALTWEDLDAIQAAHGVSSGLVFVDAGHATYEVYRQCGLRGWAALMGDGRAVFAHKIRTGSGRNAKVKIVQRYYAPRRTVVTGGGKTCAMYYWSNLNVKDCLARLRMNQDPSAGPTWEIPADAGDDYLQQMESERRIKVKGKWTWVRIGKRANHLWDCESMQVTGAMMLKLVGREATARAGETESDKEAPGEPES